MEYKVISADNHINEPPGTYVDRVPRHLKDKAPRVMRGADGGDGWSYDGSPPKVTFGLNATGGSTGQDYKNYKHAGLTWDEILPGNYEGGAHIKDNERDGVDAASIYPAFIGGAYATLKDRELALACVRAYNDWLIDDFCSADPNKLWSLGFVPVNDGIDKLLAEARRLIDKGVKGLYLPLPDAPYYERMYDPLWQLAVDAHVPVTIHRTGVSTKETPLNMPTDGPGFNVVGTIQRFFSAINPISFLCYTGVFERNPGLVFIAAEVNSGWVPSLAMQMDQEFDRMQAWAEFPFTEQPSNYFGRNVFVTVLDDYVGCKFARQDEVLARTAMFSTDYPHSTTTWPRSQEVIARLTDGMSEQTKQAILAGNALRAFQIS